MTSPKARKRSSNGIQEGTTEVDEVEDAAAWALSHMNDDDAADGPVQDSALTASGAATGTQQKQVHRFIAELQGKEEEACAALKTAVYRCRQGDFSGLKRYVVLSPACGELFTLAERKDQSEAGRTISTTALFLVELLGWILLGCVEGRFPSSSVTGNAVCRGILNSSTMFTSRCLFAVLNTSRDWALIGALRLLKGLFSFSPRVALQTNTAVANWTVTRDAKGTAANDTTEHGWKALSRLLGRRRVTAEGDTVREHGLHLAVAILKAAETNKDLAAQLVLHPMWRPFLSRALAGSGNETCVAPQQRGENNDNRPRDVTMALERMRQAEVAVLEQLGHFLRNAKSRRTRLFTDQEFFLPRLSRVVVEATDESVLDAAEALWTSIATDTELWSGDMNSLGIALAAIKPPCDSQTNILSEALSAHKSPELWHAVAEKSSLSLSPTPSLRWLAAVASAVELLDDPTPCEAPLLPSCLNRSELTAGLLFAGKDRVLVRTTTLGLITAALKRLTSNHVQNIAVLNEVASILPDMQTILNVKPPSTSTSAPYLLAWSQCICAYQEALPGRFLQCKFDWGRSLIECHEPVQRAVLLPMTTRVLASFPLGKSKLAWLRHLVETDAIDEFSESLYATGLFNSQKEARHWASLPTKPERLWVISVLQQLAQHPLLPVDTWASDFVKQALTGKPSPPPGSCCVADAVLLLVQSGEVPIEEWRRLLGQYGNQGDLLKDLDLSSSTSDLNCNETKSRSLDPLDSLIARATDGSTDLSAAAQSPTLLAAAVDELSYEGEFSAALDIISSVPSKGYDVFGLDGVLAKNPALLSAIASADPEQFRHGLLWVLSPSVFVQVAQYRSAIAFETADYLQHKPKKLRKKWGPQRFDRSVVGACCALVAHDGDERAQALANEFGPISMELDQLPRRLLPRLPSRLIDISSLSTAAIIAENDSALSQWWVDGGHLDLEDGSMTDDVLLEILETTTLPEASLSDLVKSGRITPSNAVAAGKQLSRLEEVKESVREYWYSKVVPSLPDPTLLGDASTVLAMAYSPCEGHYELLQRLVGLWGLSRSENDKALLRMILEISCMHELSRKAEYRPDSRIPRAIAKECHRLPVPAILLDNNLSMVSSEPSESLDIDAFTVFTAGRIRRADATTTDEDWQNYTPAAELDSLATELCSSGRALGALLVATSSRDKIVRDLSRDALGRITSCLELKVQGRDQSGIRLGFRDAHEVLFLLHAYLNSLPESTDQPSPSVLAHAVAQMANVVVRPESPEYEEVCHSLLARPALDTTDVPLWFDLFYSKSVTNCTHHRRWILQVLTTPTHPDYITPDTVTGPLGKRRVPEALMALTADVTQTDIQLESYSLDIMYHIIQFYCSRPAALVKFVKNHAVVEWSYNLLRDKGNVEALRSTSLDIASLLLAKLPAHPNLVGLLDLFADLADTSRLHSLAATVLPRYIRWATSKLVDKLAVMQLPLTSLLRMLSQRPTDPCLMKSVVASLKATTTTKAPAELETAFISVCRSETPGAIDLARRASGLMGLTWKSRIAIANILLRGNKRALLSLPVDALEAMSRLPTVEDLPDWPDEVDRDVIEDAETLMRAAISASA
ncbi:hypothetical protein FOL47_008783 [Perkinsus chesapeaki]|uniref:URB1 C-terminal domain-containing protein n=1 Tax=Perkinsus chesapeaki TaxID=330153 RepID=A0A7J6MT33_PERCH|nr:hypothetical protein FOL47_008783 [Perkinsus chesapeaki]